MIHLFIYYTVYANFQLFTVTVKNRKPVDVMCHCSKARSTFEPIFKCCSWVRNDIQWEIITVGVAVQ